MMMSKAPGGGPKYTGDIAREREHAVTAFHYLKAHIGRLSEIDADLLLAWQELRQAVGLPAAEPWRKRGQNAHSEHREET